MQNNSLNTIQHMLKTLYFFTNSSQNAIKKRTYYKIKKTIRKYKKHVGHANQLDSNV